MPTKSITITEADLADIIRKAVTECSRLIDSDKSAISIFSQDEYHPSAMDIDKDLFLSQLITFGNQNYVRRARQKLLEGLITSYNVDSVLRMAEQRYNEHLITFDKVPFQCDDETIECLLCTVSPFVSDSDRDEIKHFMDTKGYHVVKTFEPRKGFFSYIFEPKYTTDVTDVIFSKCHYLYHATPSIRVHKILRNGLRPTESTADDGKEKTNKEPKQFFYPGRVYLMKGDNLTPKCKNLFAALQQARAETNPLDDNEYTILQVDVSKIPRDTRFFADPMGQDGAIYTTNNITPNALTVYGTF